MKILKLSVSVLAIIYGLILGYVYLFQEQMLFAFAPVSQDHSYSFKNSTETIWLDNGEGRLNAVLFKARPDNENLVLYFKGNAGNVDKSERMAQTFINLGYDVLSMDYRGFGKSTGPLSKELLLADAEKWYDYAATRYEKKGVRVVGYSLGTLFATHIAAHRPVDNLILFAPMKSVHDVAERRYPFLPGFLNRYPLANDTNLAKSATHIRIYHGTADKIVVYESGAALKSVIKPDDIFLTVEGATHDSIPFEVEVEKDIANAWKIN